MSGTINPSFLFDCESNMKIISTNEYLRIVKNLWWRRIAKVLTSQAKRERVAWLLESAKIERTTKKGGQVNFEELVSKTTEYEPENASAGLDIKKEDFEDIKNGVLGGEGLEAAASWSKQIGAYAAIWPQLEVAKAILANETTYDGKALFATDHPINPYDEGLGDFANLFTGAPSGAYPGALPIDESVSIDVAVQNLGKLVAYTAGIKSPNGRTARGLRLTSLFVPPRLMPRAVQITNAKIIAQVASSGAGSANVEALISYLALGQPIQCDEFGAAMGGSDTDYYAGMTELLSDDLGSIVYVEREPFSVVYHGPQTSAQLARVRKFQWLTEGRNIVGLGHPYLLMKGRST